MLNQMTILKTEIILARTLADRDEVIETLVKQIDQLGLQLARKDKEIERLTPKKEVNNECQAPAQPVCP